MFIYNSSLHFPNNCSPMSDFSNLHKGRRYERIHYDELILRSFRWFGKRTTPGTKFARANPWTPKSVFEYVLWKLSLDHFDFGEMDLAEENVEEMDVGKPSLGSLQILKHFLFLIFFFVFLVLFCFLSGNGRYPGNLIFDWILLPLFNDVWIEFVGKNRFWIILTIFVLWDLLTFKILDLFLLSSLGLFLIQKFILNWFFIFDFWFHLFVSLSNCSTILMAVKF